MFELFELFYLLLIAHVIGDYVLQNDFIAQAKNKNTELGKNYWLVVLPSHSLIHSGLVYFVTGSMFIGLLELFTHTVIDYLKNEDYITFYQDQLLHLLSKVMYVVILFTWIV